MLLHQAAQEKETVLNNASSILSDKDSINEELKLLSAIKAKTIKAKFI